MCISPIFTNIYYLFNLYVKIAREQLITIANVDIVPIYKPKNITLESSIVQNDVAYV